MKIVDNTLIKLDTYIKNTTNKVNNSSGEPPVEVVYRDRIELSEKAKEIQEAKKLLDAVPDIREEKVSRIKALIENKTYEIDSKKIAIAMLKESIVNDPG